MLDTRFIFVEGIMGAGKTTIAEFLTERIARCGIVSRFLPEGPTFAQREHPLRIGPTLSDHRTAWYDVTVEEYIALSLRKWQAFVDEAQGGDTITVCDGLLFHGNMTDLLLMDAASSILHDYVIDVIECIRALRPAVIYLRRADVHEALREVCAERGDAFASYQINWKVGSPYGIRRSLHGFDGLVQLYQDYCTICDDLFSQLTMPKLRIKNEGDWIAYRREILTFLKLRPSSKGCLSRH